MASSPPPPAGKAATAPPKERRNFLVEASALVVGGLAGLVPLFSGLIVFFDPLRRQSASDALIRVTSLDALPDDGIPRQFPIVAEHLDAWNRSLEPVGAVYLRRQPGQSTPECLTATCPHAGCFVNYDTQTNTYKCPCHNSTFAVDGAIIAPSPSPRAMDTLTCEVRDQDVLVKFQNFYTGKTEKIAKS